MKVLIVNKFLHPNGGSETYIFKLGEELVRQGHEVQYFGMEHEGRLVGNRAGLYTSDMDFHSGGIRKLLYPFKIIYSGEAARKITTVLNDFVPEVVHLNNFNFQLTPSVIYAVRKWERKTKNKVKIVYTAHDSQLVCPNHLMQQYISQQRCDECIKNSTWECMKHKCIHGSFAKSMIGSMEAQLYRMLGTYRKIDVIISPSLFIKEKLETNPDLKGRIEVIRNYVDIHPAEREQADRNPKYVLFLGRYSKEKGIETLLKVCDATPEINYCFAGKGPLESEVKKRKNIEECGFVSGDKLLNLIQKAVFLVFPSECYENNPFTIMEALKLGVPVIASDIGGIPELVTDDLNGKLFRAGDVAKLKEMIVQLWNDQEKNDLYREGALKTAFSTLEEYVKRLVKYHYEG